MEERTVIGDLQMELEVLQIFCILRKCSVWHNGRQADNPFPTTPMHHVTIDFWEGSDDSSHSSGRSCGRNRIKTP